MKKLRLNALNLGAKEVLTRKQLKDVLGGDTGSETGTGTCKATATCGTNGSVSCTGYGPGGCVASDYNYVACPDQSGVMQKYNC